MSILIGIGNTMYVGINIRILTNTFIWTNIYIEFCVNIHIIGSIGTNINMCNSKTNIIANNCISVCNSVSISAFMLVYQYQYLHDVLY